MHTDALPTKNDGTSVDLYAANTPTAFWRLDVDIPEALWQEQALSVLSHLPGAAEALKRAGWPGLMAYWLGEGQFGPDHWRLSRAKRFYYGWVRALIPGTVKPFVRRTLARSGRPDNRLSWPLEPTYADTTYRLVGAVLRRLGIGRAPYVHFWPNGKRFALVLTHDVEGEAGQAFVLALAELEEKLGVRSSFNFVPEGYRVDEGLLVELKARGFEVGIHGLKHDGRLFSSRAVFEERARRINHYLEDWQACGFRAPLMHRHPEWLQSLNVAYDTSFFDTDPFEPLAGGTMSPWPFVLGHFVELPYTLVQDHTLLHTLKETTPRLWLEKTDYLRRVCALALLNSHPDYLRRQPGLRIYQDFLERMVADEECWNALPSQAARWWRARAESDRSSLPDGAVWGEVSTDGDMVTLRLPRQSSRVPLCQGVPQRPADS